MAASDLAGFIQEVTGESHLRVEEDLGGGFVRLRTSEAERRQAQQDIRCIEDAVLELLRNSRDAGARLVCIATNREGDTRNLVCIDDGEGIPRDMWERVFEPRVTSKLDTFHADQWGVHGRGMALFSIACNTAEHRVMASGPGLGCALRLRADVRALPEKTDQSSLPRLVVEEGGRKVVRGPRNINRIVTEFALAQRGGCLVFVGSPIEVAATLVDRGARVLSAVDQAFADDAAAYPVWLRPALAATPEELAALADELGLPMSVRSARRILDGQIAPLAPFTAALDSQFAGGAPAKRRNPADGARRKVRLSQADREALSENMKRAFAPVAESYYLSSDVQPAVRVSRDALVVTIPLVDAEEVGGAS